MAITLDDSVTPIIAVIILCAALLIPYIIGICFGHVRAWFPYIHEIGADDPERCVYTALFNIVSLLLYLNVQAQQYAIDRQLRFQRSNKLDDVSNWCGILLCFGLFIMANCPAIKKNKIPFFIHSAGAILFFGASLVYLGILTYFSYEAAERSDDWAPMIIRCLLMVLFILSLLGFLLFWQFGHNKPQKAMIKLSALCEWFALILVVVFFLSYEFEFLQ